MDNQQLLHLIILGLITSLSVVVIGWKVKTPTTIENWKWSNDWEAPRKAPERIEEAPALKEPLTRQATPQDAYRDALARAKSESKQVVVFFTNASCSWCQKMKAEVFPSKEVKTALQRFVFIIIDIDVDQKTADQWGVGALPTHLVVSWDEKKVKSKVGWLSAGDYVEFLR